MNAEAPEMAIVYQGQLMMVKEVKGILDGAGVNALVLQPGEFSNT